MRQSPLTRRPLHQLVREIARNDIVPPVRLMEEVLRRDPREAVPALVGVLRTHGIGTPWAPLWLIVLLGEFRDPDAAEALAYELWEYESPDPWTAQAATEALAKTGDGAMAELGRCSDRSNTVCRLYAYAALGWIGTRQARAILLDSLATDLQLADVLACALGDTGAFEAIGPLHAALSRCHPFQRIEIEVQIQRLHRREGPASPTGQDWRRRYRPSERRVFETGWPYRLRCLREHPGWRWLRTQGPSVRTLEEILADSQPRKRRVRSCFLCSLPPVSWTGVRACGLHAEELVEEQIGLLELAAAEAGGAPDVFGILAFADTRLSLLALTPTWRLIPGMIDPDLEAGAAWSPQHEVDPWVEAIYQRERDPLEPFDPEEQAWREEQREQVFGACDNPEDARSEALSSIFRVVRSTCHWLIAEGCEDLRSGMNRLRHAVARARRLAPGGHPARRLLPPATAELPDDVLEGSSEALANRPGDALAPPSDAWQAEGEAGADPDPLDQAYERRIQRQLDLYYRRWLDTPLEALDGHTPRRAKERGYRTVLLEYVKGFEAAEERRMRDGAIAYDFGWLRRELGLDTTAVMP